jgi:hypothetical protein
MRIDRLPSWVEGIGDLEHRFVFSFPRCPVGEAR